MKVSRVTNLTAAALVLAFCLQALLAIPRLSPTSDEPIHLAAGYSYWKTREFLRNPEHPPLAKLMAAIPLLFLRPQLAPKDADWKQGTDADFGQHFIYGNDADRLIFWARFPMVLLAAIGAIATFLWARDMFGEAAGVLALTLYAFCPNLLAHGMLVTTDVPLATFTVLALYLFWKRGLNPSWKADVVTGLAVGAAMTSKFSGALVPVIITVFCLARKEIKSLFIIGLASLVIIEAAYLFTASPLFYLHNMRYVNANHSREYKFFLLGDLRTRTWWYYFLVAFAVKATVPVLVLAVFASIRATRGFMERWGEVILVVTIAGVFVENTIGADPIGVRYILPAFPLLFIWLSRIASYVVMARWRVAAVSALLLWHVWSAVSSFPDYIPFFNELAGGPEGGIAILDDSNIDWAQGLKQAAEYIRTHQLSPSETYFFDGFSEGGPAYYHLPGVLTWDETLRRVVLGVPSPGTYILTSHFVTRARHEFIHWRDYKPIDKIGESLWVYKF